MEKEKSKGQLAHLEKWPLHSLYNCLFVCLLTTSYGKNCWSALPEMYPWTRKRPMSSDFNVVDSLAQGLWCAYQDRTHNSTLNFGSHPDLDPGSRSGNFFTIVGQGKFNKFCWYLVKLLTDFDEIFFGMVGCLTSNKAFSFSADLDCYSDPAVFDRTFRLGRDLCSLCALVLAYGFISFIDILFHCLAVLSY